MSLLRLSRTRQSKRDAAGRSRSGGLDLRRREAIAGLAAISSWLLGFVFFAVGPILASFALMFTRWEVLSPPELVGLDNIIRMVNDPLVGKSLYNTAFYTLLAVPGNLIAALFAALLLNVGVTGTRFYRLLIYLPSQTPAIATAILWFFIFSPTYGLANDVLRVVGIAPQKWLLDTHLVKPALVIMSIWGMGNAMIIFLAGLQAIPITLYEAAKIDGAGVWRLFRHVTVPMLSPTILFNLIIGMIGSFQVFGSVFVMTDGGPGNASLMLVLYIYRNAFETFKMGYASAMAWLLLIIVLALTLLQFAVSKWWVYYEGEVE